MKTVHKNIFFLLLSFFTPVLFCDSSDLRLIPNLEKYLQTESRLDGPILGMPQNNKLSIDASFSAITAGEGDDSAKFQEYRDIPDGVMSEFSADYWRENYRFFGNLKNIGLDDQFFHLRGESFGKYRIQFTYDQIPHRFAFDAPSLFSGIGTGSLRIDDSVQTSFQNSANDVDLAGRLSAEFGNAALFDAENLRKRAGVVADVFSFQPWQLRAELNHESRSGTRPFSGSFGFSNLVELPMPVDYDTTEIKLSGEYTKESFHFGAAYYASIFENNNNSLTFDNPFRISDSTLPEPVTIISSFQAGPSTGRIDLFPSNDYQNISFTGVLHRLPWKSTLSALFSWGFLNQNDDLVPFSTNTAIVPGAANDPLFSAADSASLPAERLNLKMDTPNLQLSFNSRPASRVQIKSSYRYYALNNDPDRVFFPGFVRTDAEFRHPITPGATFTNLPIAYDQNTFRLDFIYDLSKSSQITAGYRYDLTGRDFREVSSLQEDRFLLAFDSRPAGWIDFRASYERSNRDGDGYDFSQYYTNQGEQVFSALPFLRKYDEANRDRNRFQLQTNFYPIPEWTVSGSIIYGDDDFNDSDFGLTSDNHRVATIDTSYAITEKLDLNAYYSIESYETNQKGRQWVPGGPGDPYTVEPGLDSNSNWTADSSDDIQTVGVGFNTVLLPPKWNFSFNLMYSKSDGQIQFASPIGPFDLNPFDPGPLEEIDDVLRVTVIPEITYQWREDFGLAVGYWYDKYDIEDFNVNGFTNLPTTVSGGFNGAVLIGTLPEDYSANVFYATFKFKL